MEAFGTGDAHRNAVDVHVLSANMHTALSRASDGG
jgi:hypothetical protein